MEHNVVQKLLGKERDGLKLSFKTDKEACLIYLFFFLDNMFFSMKDFVVLL